MDREADRHMNRRTDGRTDMTKLIVAFPMFANARNKMVKDLVTAIH